jgi:hypothetical protein
VKIIVAVVVMTNLLFFLLRYISAKNEYNILMH